jgi:hypothetical protein
VPSFWPAWVRRAWPSAVAGTLVLALALALAVVAHASPAASLTLPAVPSIVSADGDVVAAIVPGNRKGRCAQIVLWRLGHAPVTVKTIVQCDSDGIGLDSVAELALATRTVAWQETNGGNNLELSISTATLARPKEREISYVENGGGAAGDPAGDYTGDLVGHGRLLAYASWTECDEAGGDYARACSNGLPDVYDQALRGTRGRVLRSGSGVLHPVWTDGTAILIRHADRSLLLIGPRGGGIRSFPAIPGLVGAVFQGSQLVTLTPTSLTLWNAHTGAKLRSFALGPGTRVLEDLDGGIAVLGSHGTTHLIRLSDGRGATFARAAHAQLEPQGLYFASGPRLVFLPRADVARRLG